MEIERVNDHKPHRHTGELRVQTYSKHAGRAAGPKPQVVLTTPPPKHAKTLYTLVAIDQTGGAYAIGSSDCAVRLPVGQTILQAGLSETVSWGG